MEITHLSFLMLDENSEYELAKAEYERLQIRISKLKDMVANSVIISTENVDTSKVSILTTVRVLNKTYNMEMDFTIVPETDIDLKNNTRYPHGFTDLTQVHLV